MDSSRLEFVSVNRDVLSNPGDKFGTLVTNMCGQGVSSPINNPYYLFGDLPLPIVDFGKRLAKYFSCSTTCFVVACVYLLRVQNTHPEMFYDTHSAHKLMLSSLLVATKFLEDRHCQQAHYAKCGGIEVEELNQLESHFLSLIGFSAYVSPQEFNMVVKLFWTPSSLHPRNSF